MVFGGCKLQIRNLSVSLKFLHNFMGNSLLHDNFFFAFPLPLKYKTERSNVVLVWYLSQKNFPLLCFLYAEEMLFLNRDIEEKKLPLERKSFGTKFAQFGFYRVVGKA